MLKSYFCCCFFKYLCAVRPLICFGLYMCGILKRWQHPSRSLRNNPPTSLAATLSDGFSPSFQKEHGSGAFRCLRCWAVSRVFPGWTSLYQKKRQRHGRDERVTVLSNVQTSSIIFQFAATLKRFDVNILVLPDIQHTHTHKHTHTHTPASRRQSVASSGNIQLFLSTLHWQTVYYVSLCFFSSLGNAEQNGGISI